MNRTDNLYIDIHVLQTVPPSCVNRDDTGSPKTAVYGGVTRARVSSQAWKKAIRDDFRKQFAAEELGSRTKRIVDMVAEKVTALAPEQDSQKLAIDALTYAGLSINAKKPEKGTDSLFFMSPKQAEALAKLICEGNSDKKAYKDALYQAPSVDMILFGRMVASDPSLNYDAAVQVAHSISTHEVHNEFDYFTAVDDLGDEDNAGAGHIGTVEFNSSTLYRYAAVNVREAERWLGEDTPRAVRSFVGSFLRSMPTGKQNTFANRTFPDCVYVTLRRDQPVNLAGAFEQPIRSREGYAVPSEERLAAYAKETYDLFVDRPALALGISRGGAIGEIAEILPREELLDRLEQAVRESEVE